MLLLIGPNQSWHRPILQVYTRLQVSFGPSFHYRRGLVRRLRRPATGERRFLNRTCLPKRRRFDVLVCWRLDRLGRNLKHLISRRDRRVRAGTYSRTGACGFTAGQSAGQAIGSTTESACDDSRSWCLSARGSSGVGRLQVHRSPVDYGRLSPALGIDHPAPSFESNSVDTVGAPL
jgi:Resolvase, N terminal domain